MAPSVVTPSGVGLVRDDDAADAVALGAANVGVAGARVATWQPTATMSATMGAISRPLRAPTFTSIDRL
jgi:hypothetical protein